MAMFHSYVTNYQRVYPLRSQYYPMIISMKPYKAIVNPLNHYKSLMKLPRKVDPAQFHAKLPLRCNRPHHLLKGSQRNI